MAIFARETIRSEVVTLDGNEYIDCTFIECTLVYGGGSFIFSSNAKDCVWQFRDEAMNTVRLLVALKILPEDARQLFAIPAEIDKHEIH